MKGAVVDRTGKMASRASRPTPAAAGVGALVAAIGDFASELAATATAGAFEVRSVGVVVPGLIDEAAGIARYAANLGWRDLPLVKLLAARLGLPVALGHDVRAGGLAEGLVGAAVGVEDFLFLPLGTGIAGAIVVGRNAYAGAVGYGGEIGHVPVIPDGEPCRCGQRGCLEVYASAAGIARRYRAAHPSAGDAESIDATGILALAERDDPVANRVWTDAVRALSLALASYTLTLDPSLVVIGGGLAGAGAALLDPVRAQLAERLAFRAAPEITTAALGDRAGCLGAAILAWQVCGVPADRLGWTPIHTGQAAAEGWPA